MAEYIGPVDLDGSLTHLVLAATTGSAPTAVSYLPTYNLYGVNFATPIAAGTTHKNNGLAAVTGAYGISHTIRAASGFAAGNSYHGIVNYQMKNDDVRRQGFTFRVV